MTSAEETTWEHGHLKLEKRVAKTACCEVHVAWHLGPHDFRKRVCVKSVKLSDPRSIERLIAAARSAAALTTSQIVRVHEIRPQQGGFQIISEWVEGASLLELLTRAGEASLSVPLGALALIFDRICEGLEDAHSEGVPHGHLCPTNALVSVHGEVKLSDVATGIALLPPPGTSEESPAAWAYLAPEQLAGELPSPRSDQFAVGAMLYEATVGMPLFHRDTVEATRSAVLLSPIPRPTDVVPGYPAALEKVVLRCLSRDPDERYESASELGEAITAAISRDERVAREDELAAFIRLLFPQRANNASGTWRAPAFRKDSRGAELFDRSEHSVVQALPVPDGDENKTTPDRPMPPAPDPFAAGSQSSSFDGVSAPPMTGLTAPNAGLTAPESGLSTTQLVVGILALAIASVVFWTLIYPAL